MSSIKLRIDVNPDTSADGIIDAFQVRDATASLWAPYSVMILYLLHSLEVNRECFLISRR